MMWSMLMKIGKKKGVYTILLKNVNFGEKNMEANILK